MTGEIDGIESVWKIANNRQKTEVGSVPTSNRYNVLVHFNFGSDEHRQKNIDDSEIDIGQESAISANGKSGKRCTYRL